MPAPDPSHRAGRRRPVPARAGPARGRRRLVRALLGRRSARIGGRCRADERGRSRLRHGGVPRPVSLGRSAARRRGLDDGARLGYGYRRSTVGPSQVVLEAELAVERGSSEEERASVTDIVTLAARAPARRLQCRLCLHQPRGRLGRPADRGGRAEGLPTRDGAGLEEARQLHSGRQGRTGRRRARPHGPRAYRRAASGAASNCRRRSACWASTPGRLTRWVRRRTRDR